jgi:diguanylate cyclase (GGDEF)-like protein
MRIEMLLQFVSACARLREYESLIAHLAQRTHWLLEFERLTVMLCDDNRQILKTIIIEDHASCEVPSDKIHSSELRPLLETLKTGAASNGAGRIYTPLISDGCMIGVLCFARRSGDYSSPDVQLVQFLADCLAGTFERLAQSSVAIDPSSNAISALKWLEKSRRMTYLAQHDILTGLPNRLLLNERLAWALASSSRYRRSLAVLFLDLDRFKEINDSLGHGTGDQVLRQISDRLVRCVRSSDTVSRIGGDEFVILLSEIEDEKDAAICAGKIISAVTAPLKLGLYELYPTLSIGIGIYPGDGEDAETLIRNADTAMYHAKAGETGKYQFFRQDMNVVAFDRALSHMTVRRPASYAQSAGNNPREYASKVTPFSIS